MLRFAMILAGGVGSRLCVLSDRRAKPAVPFGGKYRIIDFTLSNCVNSGLTDIAILTQYNPVSLNQHIGIGKPWDLDRRHGGVHLLQPYIGWRDTDWYKGTADAVFQNAHEVRQRNVDDVLILSGDHVYTMDYHAMYEFHTARRADLTIGVIEVPAGETHKFGILELERDGEVTHFIEKPKHPPRSNTASMGVYLFRTDTLVEALEHDADDPRSSHDFGKDVIPALLGRRRVYAYPFAGYWQDIGTLESFYEANLDLASTDPELDLNDSRWAVHTVDTSYQPVKFIDSGRATSSLLSNGCIIYGNVDRSVLSPGVVVEEGATVRNSIILNDVWIGPDSHLERVIVDKSVRVGRGATIGRTATSATANRRCPEHLSQGLTIIGKHSAVPDGASIGCNVRIGTDVSESHFTSPRVADGEVVEVPGELSH